MPNSNGLNTGIGILAAVARQERRLSERTGSLTRRGNLMEWSAAFTDSEVGL
jgi:hypothetical protein